MLSFGSPNLDSNSDSDEILTGLLTGPFVKAPAIAPTLTSTVVGSIFMTASLTSIDGSHVTVTLQDYVLAQLQQEIHGSHPQDLTVGESKMLLN